MSGRPIKRTLWHRQRAVRPRAEVHITGEGVPQDNVEALSWFRRAAEQGKAGAQYNLGVMYASGEDVPQDYVEALAWYRRAAEQGHASAQFGLGVMYATGEGVPQDNVEAHMWLNLAASRSSGEQRERTVTTRDAVAERMTPADLGEAQRRAREWYAAHPALDKNAGNVLLGRVR